MLTLLPKTKGDKIKIFYTKLTPDILTIPYSKSTASKLLGMSQSGVVCAVNKGEKTAKEKNYQLVV